MMKSSLTFTIQCKKRGREYRNRSSRRKKTNQ
jgi:hypothetical protein